MSSWGGGKFTVTFNSITGRVMHFIWPFYPIIPWGPFRFLFKTSAGYVYALRFPYCLFDKSATDFHIKNKRLSANPAVTLQRDSISEYSTAVFK
jgi:hypothetical protein